jgi:hypothetical protein
LHQNIKDPLSGGIFVNPDILPGRLAEYRVNHEWEL